MNRSLVVALALTLTPTLARAEVNPKELIGTWHVNVEAAKKRINELQADNKKNDAVGLAMVAAVELTMTFERDGSVRIDMSDPFGKTTEKRTNRGTWEVAAVKGDTISVRTTDKKGTEMISVTIVGDALTLVDAKGVVIPFQRQK